MPFDVISAEWTRLTVKRNAFACDDDKITWVIAKTEDDRAALALLNGAKSRGICIDIKEGDVFYAGRLHNKFIGLIEIRRNISSKTYWTALGLFE